MLKTLPLSVSVFLIGCAHTTPSSSVSIESDGVRPSQYVGADIVSHIGASTPVHSSSYVQPAYSVPTQPLQVQSTWQSAPTYAQPQIQQPQPSHAQPVQTYALVPSQPIAYTQPVAQINTAPISAPIKSTTVIHSELVAQPHLGIHSASPLLQPNSYTIKEPVTSQISAPIPTAAKISLQPAVSRTLTFDEHVKNVWGQSEYLEANNHNYVKYFSGYQTRAHIDFNRGKIRVETTDRVNPKAQLQSGIIQTLLIPSDPTQVELFSDQNITPNGKPFLYGQVVDQDGKPIEWEWRANRFSNYLLTNKLQSRTSTHGTIHYVDIDMVSNHLSQREYQYANVIRDAAQRYGIDEGLIYGIIKVESNFNPYAVSRDGAYGLMQIVPRAGGADVFKRVKVRSDLPSKDYLLDPVNNIDTGVAYLYVLKNHYLKNIANPTTQHYAMASAYNGGIGGVLTTFDQDRAKAMQDINSLKPEQVYWALANKHPKHTARLYLENVIKFEQEFEQGKL